MFVFMSVVVTVWVVCGKVCCVVGGLKDSVLSIGVCCVLYMLVRYASPSGPMCLRCLMLTLSGPVELFLLCFIATWTCVVVSVRLVVCSLSVFLSMCLFVCVFYVSLCW